MCIFCKIVSREIPTEFLYEDDLVVAFRDARPIAPVHVLVIPKKHIESVADISEKDEKLMGRMILVAKKIAEDLKISKNGYKLLFRVGEYGGQEVRHIHLHLIGGAKLRESIEPI
ncbi:MAG: Hit-like protein involved in cell-cycle regulation [Candidatus Moranbacteria bacterium GW2011_GWC1_45_18]|nr:MAG: Histidine triad (HIT) protein [Candidatus Moranbacteria bacterium GW2011_GWC2_40_12]KKT32525.1 MAG: Histidine triad (HIT) protein [Candidatus Moranbacteria bacterium GW2011_GWF2_44_10]KKT99710.1 MAG: Hit-like protein involved in cell-cycle regulation [Candidatus Moranbacteria bacterium GW2011_GWC1_45_18]OGI24501.1 MAG: histidine triad nucleotide-binding protein [Candidatus Moranbacteria bacterium RIFOXYA1_FULL_44_8]OGI39453.1 MAG: histidine triad nucleotide-binding protein [Candidatus M